MTAHANRVFEISTSTGNGNMLLGGAENGFYSFFASFGTGVEFGYIIENPVTGENETGLGEIIDNGGGSYSLQRNSVERSSNSNNLVVFAAGRKYIQSPLLASEADVLTDPTLVAFGGLTIVDNSLTIGTGADAFSQVVFAANRFPARASTGNLEAKTITDYGLSLVACVDAAAGRTALGLGTVATLAVDTDTTLAANSDTSIASQKAVKTYVDTAVTGLLDFKGATDCSANPNYPAALKGDAYVVSVAGKIGGASGKAVDIGDVYVAAADNAGGTEASVGANWFTLEHNLEGAVLTGGALGTPSSGTLTNCTGLPIASGVSGLAAGIATFLATPSSSNLLSAITDETGTGVLVFSISPTFTGTIGAENLTLTGNLSVQGNTTIGNASSDTLTVNAAAWTLPNAVRVTKTAEGGAENIFQWDVSDDAVGKFELLNGSATVGVFAPNFKGTHPAAGPGVTFWANAVTDTGTNPMLIFRGTIADGTVTNRPLLGIWNHVTSGLEVSAGFKVSKYGNIATVGSGVPAIYGRGRSTAQTAAVASVAAYTVGAADASFIVSANVLVTTATSHNFNVTVSYTDEGNTARTVTMLFLTLAGTGTSTIANASGAVPYHGLPANIRAKAGTTITIATTGTFTTVTYNVEGTITQIS